MRIEDLTPENATAATVQDLIDLRYRAIQLYDAKFKGNNNQVAKQVKKGRLIWALERSELLEKNKIIVRELRGRGEKQKDVHQIDRETFKKSMIGIDVGLMPKITVVRNFAAIHGDYIDSPKTTEIVELVFKCSDENHGEPMVQSIIQQVHRETKKDIGCLFSLDGPEGSYIPVYDLVLMPRLITAKHAPEGKAGAIPHEDIGRVEKDIKWDGSKERGMMSLQQLKKASAWFDERCEFRKMAFRFIHHRAEDGKVVFRGLSKAMNTLMDEQKSGRIPIEEREAAFEHLARHYREYGKTPPAFKTNKADKRTIMKPYPTEHSCRLRDPQDYKNFARTERTSGSGKKYAVIYGIKTVEGKRVSEAQSFRYPKSSWTETEAREHSTDHGGKKFEPAVEKAGTVFKIMKVSEEKQLVGGIIYEPNAVDTQSEYTDAAEIEKGMIAFMEKYSDDARRIKIEHMGSTYHFPIIESFIPEVATKKGKDTIPAGAWWLMVKVTDSQIWKLIKDGTLTGFSMGGTARGGHPD